MTERLQPNNLTREAQNPYPKGGDIFMSGEPGGGEFQSPTMPVRSSQGGSRESHSEALQAIRELPPGIVAKATRQLSVAQGIHSEEDRMVEAEKALDRNLTEKQKEALIKAHYVGKDEAGKGEGQAGIGNYTREQLAEKARILKGEGFEKQERRTLMEAGLVGDSVDDEASGERFEPFSVSGIVDSRLKAIFRQYNDLGQAGLIADESLLEDLNKSITQRLMEIEAERLATIRDTEVAEGEEPINIPEMPEDERALVYEGMFRIQADLAALRYATTPQSEESERSEESEQEKWERMNIQEKSYYLTRLADLKMKNIVEKEKNNETLTDTEKKDRAEIKGRIDEVLDRAQNIISSGFPHEVLGAVHYFKEMREQLITEVIFKSYDDATEAGDYEISLYGASNLDILLGYLSKDDPDAYRNFLSLKTAARYFYMMNKDLQGGNFESFQRVAESLNYQHFEVMKKISGSAVVMRLFEEKFNEVMKRDKRITDKGYREIKEEVKKSLEYMNERGAVESEYSKEREKDGNEDREMKPWEISRALGVARAFYSISYRTTEKIAVGQVPFDRKRFAGFPFESMVRVFNHNEWMMQRFKVSDDSHGQDFLRGQLERWRELMKDKGNMLGINAIEEFGGVNVVKMENGGQYKTSGIYSGWRMENMLFDEVKFNLRGKDITIKEFMDEYILKEVGVRKSGPDKGKQMKIIDRDILDEIKARAKKHGKTEAEVITEEDQIKYADLFAPLIGGPDTSLDIGLSIGLSAFLKNSDTGGRGKIAYVLRQRIWERVAATNVPVMMDYLSGLTYKGGYSGEKARSLDDILRGILGKASDWKEISENDKSIRMDTLLKEFRKKALLNHEAMMKRAMGEPSNIRIEEYSPEEEELERLIKLEGAKLAPHLADISFPYMPFMNDIPFDVLNYEEAGSSFFKRRSGGDMGGYNAGQQGLFAIMENAAGAKPEEIFKALGEMIKGIAGPEGDQVAREAVYSIFEEYVDLISATPEKRQLWVKIINEAVRKPTSRAQEWAGHTAQSIIEAEVGNTIAMARAAGILNKDLEERAKKRLGAMLWNIIKAIFRDIAPNVPLIVGVSFAKAVAGTK